MIESNDDARGGSRLHGRPEAREHRRTQSSRASRWSTHRTSGRSASHGQGNRDREPGHRHALDAQRAQAALPRLERHDRRPQLQLARRDPPRRRRLRPESPEPCDDNGHGTHTTGTTVGDDGAGNQIGVAPGAKWIGCRNMDQGNGTPATYTECFQFFIAPTDLKVRTRTRPAAARDQQQLAVPAERGLRAGHAADGRREHRPRGSSSRFPRATRARTAARSPIRRRSTRRRSRPGRCTTPTFSRLQRAAARSRSTAPAASSPTSWRRASTSARRSHSVIGLLVFAGHRWRARTLSASSLCSGLLDRSW